MPTSVLTDTLIPQVYETLGIARSNNLRVEPANDDAVVTRLLNRAYVQFAQETGCFRYTKAYAETAVVTSPGLLTIDPYWYRIEAARWGTLTENVTPLTHRLMSDIRDVDPAFRTHDASDPQWWAHYSANTLLLYPKPVTLRTAWVSGTAYSFRDLVPVTVGPTTTYYVCLIAHTAAPADEPGVGANWTTYWSVSGDYLTLDGFVVPYGTDTNPYALLGATGDDFVDEPAFSSVYWDALPYRAAVLLGRGLLRDDDGIPDRVAYADEEYRAIRDQYMTAAMGAS